MKKFAYIDRPMEPLIGADEAAEYLGFSSATVRRYANAGRLPSIAFPGKTPGKCLHRFRVSDLKDYVESLKRRPVLSVQPESQDDLALRAG